MGKVLDYFGKEYKIFTFRNIPVKLHMSFALMMIILWTRLGVVFIKHDVRIHQTIMVNISITLLYACVILHEFGHALAARKCGYETNDIVIYPIGGVATIKFEQATADQEIYIAIMGPIVTLIIAASLTALSLLFHIKSQSNFNFITLCGIMNFTMLVFNMLPFYPLDGGRVLRALVSKLTGKNKATLICGRFSEIVSLVFVFVSIKYHYWNLLFIFILIPIFIECELLVIREKIKEDKYNLRTKELEEKMKENDKELMRLLKEQGVKDIVGVSWESDELYVFTNKNNTPKKSKIKI